MIPDGPAHRLFNSGSVRLFHLSIDELSSYIIELATILPSFSRFAAIEDLKRETYLIDLIEQVLARMPALSAVDAINRSDEFEVQYRREVARKLDRLQLFGITLPERSTR